jgi:hypothetical protein
LSVLLADLSARGIVLQAHDDRLQFRPCSAITPDLSERLKRHKAQLLAILPGAGGRAAEAEGIIRYVREGEDHELAEFMVEVWQERLSICTTDGGLTLAEAEVVALEQLWNVLDSRASASYT